MEPGNMNVRHTILIITYNQEDLIGKCLDSVLSQSEKPYEVVVCDDCSSDRTWEVVQTYASQYNTIIKAHRNDHNLGVFGNVNNIKELATGDFVNFVSADDMLPDGALEGYSRFIIEHNLNCNDPFVIFTDCMILTGDQRTIISNVRNMKYDAFESCLLGCLWGWDTGLSRGLLQKMDPLNIEIGYQADLLWHLDKISKAENHYYIPMLGYMYRANVGVTVNTKLREHIESKKNVHQIIYQKYRTKITAKALRYLNFDMVWNVYLLTPNCANYLAFIYTYFRAGQFRHNNQYRNNFKMLIPIGVKRVIKKIIQK